MFSSLFRGEIGAYFGFSNKLVNTGNLGFIWIFFIGYCSIFSDSIETLFSILYYFFLASGLFNISGKVVNFK